MNTVEMEAAQMIKSGMRQVTPEQMRSEIQSLGYRFNLSERNNFIARYVAGPRSGQTYPACHFSSPREADTGRTYSHFEARRDERFRQLQTLRREIFCVVKDRKGVSRIGTF